MNILTFFANHPERICAVSALFLTGNIVFSFTFHLKGKEIFPGWPSLVASCLWLGIAILDYYRLSGKYCTRLDLTGVLSLIFGLTIGLIITQITLMVRVQTKPSQIIGLN